MWAVIFIVGLAHFALKTTPYLRSYSYAISNLYGGDFISYLNGMSDNLMTHA